MTRRFPNADGIPSALNVTEEMFEAARIALGVTHLNREEVAKAYTAMRAAEEYACAELVAEARFLCERLEDFENELTDEHDAREYHGHVRPSLHRLSALLAKIGGRNV